MAVEYIYINYNVSRKKTTPLDLCVVCALCTYTHMCSLYYFLLEWHLIKAGEKKEEKRQKTNIGPVV